MFSKAKIAELKNKFARVDVDSIQDAELREKARNLKGKQGGFTLLELLVVMAILAAIAGTASIALQDTDARASAAAHVAMMDELNKGIRTFRVLNKNTLPTDFDSLLEKANVSTAAAANAFAGGALGSSTSILGFEDSLSTITLSADMAKILTDGGIDSLRYIQNDLEVDGADSCTSAELANTIASRGNAVVAGNIFLSIKANGCGASVGVAAAQRVAVWTGGFERVMGSAGQAFDTTTLATDGSAVTAGEDGAPIMMAVGLGPSSTLFNANDLGGMTTVPVYRHVSETQYGRFVALFNIGNVKASTGGGGGGTTYSIDAADQVTLAGIIDGAGDTKEEELGEWDGTRNTI